MVFTAQNNAEPPSAHVILVPHLRGTIPRELEYLTHGTYTPTVRDRSASPDDVSRRLAFARIVALALAKFQDQATPPGQRQPSQEDFADRIGIRLSTLDRWLRGRWRKDPTRDKVDNFIRAVGEDTETVYGALGWGVEKPTRTVTQPARNPRTLDVDRVLEDPHVPKSYKAYISQTLELLVRNVPKDPPKGPQK